MKNLFFTALCILFSTMLFSQELQRKKVTGLGGDDYPDNLPPSSYPSCDSCFTFDLSFDVTEIIPSSTLNNISLIATSLTGTVTGFDNTAWEVDTIIGQNCNTYTYTQDLSICFEVDSVYCSPGQDYRIEDVTFHYEIFDDCLADYLSADPINDYFDQNCVGPNANTCDPVTFTFVNICCVTPPPPKRNSNSNIKISPKISPNPCLDHLIVENLEGGEEIVISSVLGNKLKSIRVPKGNTELRIEDLNNIPVGVNLLYITKKGKIVTQIKFVKQ